jgi:hypothetical protein
MTLSDRLRIREHALADTQEIAIGCPIERVEKRFELSLHFRLAREGRSKSADDLEEDGVRVSIGYDAVVELVTRSVVRRVANEQDVTQTRLPSRGARRARRGPGCLMNQSKTHGVRILASLAGRSVTALSARLGFVGELGSWLPTS